MPPRPPAIRAEGMGGLFKARVEAREGIADDTNNNGRVVENVGEEDGREGSDEVEGNRGRKRKEERGKCLYPAAWTEQSIKSRRDDDCGKHEGNRRQCTQKRLAAEVKAGEEIGGGQAKQQGEEGGEYSLIERKPKNGRRELKIFGGEGGETEGKRKDAPEGIKEEEAEESNGNKPE